MMRIRLSPTMLNSVTQKATTKMPTTDKTVLTINVPIKVTMENVDDILCTAFDNGYGGCWYWMNNRVSNHPLLPDEYAWHGITKYNDIVTVWDDEHTEFKLDLEKFLKGLQMWVEHKIRQGDTIEFDGDQIDCGMIDAGDADNIVQFALFGELVYG